MGDPESDEHLRIFKCLVDTGADVLRDTVERKLLINTCFEQYLNQNKHKFYHQFEKRRCKPCCLGNPHSCVVNGRMDKTIFFKMYNKMAELDIQYCLDRFVVNTDISVDKLDLSDLNFFLWNSATLSTPEEQSLQSIMSTRSAICHSSSSRIFSLNELENFWLSLKNDLLLFAEPYRYKKSIEREITTLRNYNLNKTESKKIRDEMHVELKKILHGLKLETQTKNESIENMVKEETDGLKKCIRLENNSIKTHINEKVQELIDSERTVCKKMLSNKRRMNRILELEEEGMNKSSTRFKFMKRQQAESNRKHQLTTIECKDEMKTKVIEEGLKTRQQNEDQNKSLDKKLTETETRVCKRVAQSQTNMMTKMEEEAIETRRLIGTGFKILLGVLGKQKVNLGINQEQIVELVETSDAQDIYLTSKLNQQCLTADKEKNVIENLQSEIEIPPSNSIKSDASEKQAFQVIVKKVNSIILNLKATPGIFKSVETLKSALLTLVKNVQIAGKIDPETEDTVTVDLSFDSPLTKDQIAVVKCLFSKEWNDDNNDKQFFKELPSSGAAKIESYQEHETSPHQGKSEAVTRTLCQACKQKDKQIKKYKEQTKKNEASLRIYKRQGLFSTTHSHNCRNCSEKDEIIIELDKKLCAIRRHLVQIKENKLLEKTLLEEDLLKLITLATQTICADESIRPTEKESKRVNYSLRSNEIPGLMKEITYKYGEEWNRSYDQDWRSDLNNRLRELKREYARKFYTKAEKQKGLAIIFHGDRTRYFSHSSDSHLQEFFEEMGFVVKFTNEIILGQLGTYMTDEMFYCTLIVFTGNEELDFTYLIRRILRRPGQPLIVMTDFTLSPSIFRETTEETDMLTMMPFGPFTGGPHQKPDLKPVENNILEDFMEVTRSNRFTDIMDILTRMNELYDRPVIAFMSTLRKKFSFL